MVLGQVDGESKVHGVEWRWLSIQVPTYYIFMYVIIQEVLHMIRGGLLWDSLNFIK